MRNQIKVHPYVGADQPAHPLTVSSISIRPADTVCNRKNISFYFPIKAYVVGTQKNRLNETVLLSIKNICLKFWLRKYLLFYAEFFFNLNL